MRPLILGIWALLSAFTLSAQNPIKWSFSTKDAGAGQFDLILTGTIEDGWATYSQYLENEDGPVATTLTFKEGKHYKLLGETKESGDKTTEHDKVFDMKISKFKHKAVFTQRIQVIDYAPSVEGYISYMVCNEEMCLPPRDVQFAFTLKAPVSGTKPN